MAIPKPITGKGARTTTVASAQSSLPLGWGRGPVQRCVLVGRALLNKRSVLYRKVEGGNGGPAGRPQRRKQRDQVKSPLGLAAEGGSGLLSPEEGADGCTPTMVPPAAARGGTGLTTEAGRPVWRPLPSSGGTAHRGNGVRGGHSQLGDGLSRSSLWPRMWEEGTAQ